MGEGKLDTICTMVHGCVEPLCAHLLVEEVKQTVSAREDLLIEIDREAGIQIGIIPESLLNEFIGECVVAENRRITIGNEFDECPVRLFRPSLAAAGELSFGKHRFERVAIAV